MSTEELACTYSALILADDDIPITAEKLTTLMKAANLNVESIWPTIFARALNKVDIKELLTNVASGPSAGAVAGIASTEPQALEAKKEESKQEAKKEESESEDEDMGFGLFD